MVRAAQSKIVAAVLVLLAVLGANLAARSEGNGVHFAAEFPSPLLTAGPLAGGPDTPIHFGLRITNRTGNTLRFSSYRSILPELLDRTGAVIPFEFGANRSPMPRASDYPVLLPEHSLIISLDASIELGDGQIAWKGNQGLLGNWNVSRAASPYRFRLRYSQLESMVGPLQDQPGTLSGFWIGEGTTEAVMLPEKFAD
jgi:hypothetical protein